MLDCVCDCRIYHAQIPLSFKKIMAVLNITYKCYLTLENMYSILSGTDVKLLGTFDWMLGYVSIMASFQSDAV